MGKSFIFFTIAMDHDANLRSGGVRGIIALDVLRAIEQSLGGKIPVQRFFDLIVGTRFVSHIKILDRLSFGLLDNLPTVLEESLLWESELSIGQSETVSRDSHRYVTKLLRHEHCTRLLLQKLSKHYDTEANLRPNHYVEL
jgi:hypothetical protein